MKPYWISAAVLTAAIAVLPCAGTAFAEETSAESSAVLTESTEATETVTTNGSMQLPNPMVPYTSYREMMDVLGFRPLVLPRAEGYELTNAFVIDGLISDLRYSSRYGDPALRSQITIRTGRKSDLQARDETTEATVLSGIYSVTWRPLELGSYKILIAQISDTSFVACWTQGEYAFACEGDNFNRWDFTHRIIYDLLDVTDHYYFPDPEDDAETAVTKIAEEVDGSSNELAKIETKDEKDATTPMLKTPEASEATESAVEASRPVTR